MSHSVRLIRHGYDERRQADVTGEWKMQARIKNPGMAVPGAIQAIQALIAAIQKAGVPPKVLHLAHLRASQINGCGFCVDYGVKHAKQDGETDERLHAVAAWREAPYFTEAERAALLLAEEMTRLDPRDPVPDPVWKEAARHYEQPQLAALVLWIATTNLFNRSNIAVRQPANTVFFK
jgi:AhpD family alkylhydroperoxidase